jgi:adenylate cyclase
MGGTLSIYKFMLAEKERKFIRRVFSYYVSPEVIKELISKPDKLKLGGERKDITVMFADIKEFTKISTKMTPEKLVETLNEFLSEMSEIIFKHGGTLDKYIGDEIMAFWGAPVEYKDHPERCLNCAIEMMKKLEAFNLKQKRQNKPEIKLGIGINSGEAIVGNLGSFQRLAYTACGDNVNLASRLQELTRVYNTDIIISEFTYKRLPPMLNEKISYLDTTKVRGREEEVKIYTIRT